MSLRYSDLTQSGMQLSRLLHCHRPEDSRENLWNLLRGGLTRHALSGCLSWTRCITSIREDVRFSGLWDLAAGLLGCWNVRRFAERSVERERFGASFLFLALYV